MTVKLRLNGTPDERTKAALAAAHDLTCLGEILEAIGTNEDVTGALVSWLGERVGKATDVVNAVLLGLPGEGRPMQLGAVARIRVTEEAHATPKMAATSCVWGNNLHLANLWLSKD